MAVGQIRLDDSTRLIENCDVLLFCHDADRSVDLNGLAYSPLIDSIHEDFTIRGLKCLSIAHPWSVLTGEKGYGKPISMNRTIFINGILRLIFRKEQTTNPYKKIFEKSNCRLVITIGAPDYLCSEARRKGIYHIELLHGIGYTSMKWGWLSKKVEYLPQCILALDGVSAITFAPLSKRGIKIMEVPHPFLKRYNTKYVNKLPIEWRIEKLGNHKKEILVTLQWAYAGDHGLNMQFANILKNGLFFDEITELVAGNKEVFWRFRFHPVQLRNKNKYKNLFSFMDNFVIQNPNAEWETSSMLSLPSVLMNCDGIISMSSMSCYEAAALGVQSLMLCPTIRQGGINQGMFEDLVKEGYVLKDEVSYSRINSWIHSVKKLPPRFSNLSDHQAWEDTVMFLMNTSDLVKSKR